MQNNSSILKLVYNFFKEKYCIIIIDREIAEF